MRFGFARSEGYFWGCFRAAADVVALPEVCFYCDVEKLAVGVNSPFLL